MSITNISRLNNPKHITNQELGLFFIGLAVCNLQNIERASNTNRKLLRSQKIEIARLCRSEFFFFFFYHLNIYCEKIRLDQPTTRWNVSSR